MIYNIHSAEMFNQMVSFGVPRRYLVAKQNGLFLSTLTIFHFQDILLSSPLIFSLRCLFIRFDKLLIFFLCLTETFILLLAMVEHSKL